jgi:hypothetical protein
MNARFAFHVFLVVVLLAQLSGCATDDAANAADRSQDQSALSQLVGDWRPTVDSVVQGQLDAFGKAFIAARTRAYAQRGLTEEEARKKALSDYEAQNTSFSAPNPQDLPTLSLEANGGFTFTHDGREYDRGTWETTSSQLTLVDEAGSSVVFQLGDDGATLAEGAGELILDRFGEADEYVWRRVTSFDQ